ncbi:putative uncharacterized protein [Waddlia chondrophila 2032/99]|uniref:Uncharacterized protein n=2 Tax=Waddlia chondrophila TaxID=71667 RepID=D6YWU7_WADCW|nr:hypothetical protein [Waddlia chondrophila]ADI38608.1 hypothetical protein wcw_1251 [Waddlia chondrophila WSU 86-1044]CCB91690.1 putative uncharacterized protein [Waddlia chondrophila 2032/99]
MALGLISAIASTTGSKVVTEVTSTLLHGPKTTRDTIKERLDPVALLAIVALMRFQQSDTKIHIGDHSITVSHSSDYTYIFNLRGIARTYTGDSHEDLALIKSAIKTVASWHDLHIEDNSEIREFMEHVSKGLNSLMATYVEKHPMASDALEFYQAHIEWYKTEAPEDVEELNEVTAKVKGLWDKRQIDELNGELRAMGAKQGKTPIATKILCRDEIYLYLSKLQVKSEILKEIYTKK